MQKSTFPKLICRIFFCDRQLFLVKVSGNLPYTFISLGYTLVSNNLCTLCEARMPRKFIDTTCTEGEKECRKTSMSNMTFSIHNLLIQSWWIVGFRAVCVSSSSCSIHVCVDLPCLGSHLEAQSLPDGWIVCANSTTDGTLVLYTRVRWTQQCY